MLTIPLSIGDNDDFQIQGDALNIDKNRLLDQIKRFNRLKILVIGDLILDEFVWGNVRRISPEAPVPVVEVARESLRLGGSANVVNNLNALGCKSALCGVVGKDQNGEKLKKILIDMDVDCNGIIQKDNRPTAIKTRVIAQHQQVVRFDKERVLAVSNVTRDKIIYYIKSILNSIDGVIISDYGKGVITRELLEEVIPMITGQSIPLAVDPKLLNFPYYNKVTVITPNHYEAAEASGFDTENEEGLIDAGNALLKKQESDYILITRGENGMSLFEKRGEITHIPTVARDVYDVTGAGDTVIATIALALAGGASMKEAAVMSNYAAGIVVGKLGTATVSVDELTVALEAHK